MENLDAGKSNSNLVKKKEADRVEAKSKIKQT